MSVNSAAANSRKWPTYPLGEVCDVRRGSTITKKKARPGDIPVVAGGISPAYFHDTPNRPGSIVTVSGSGANAGYVNFYDQPIWASDCSTILPKGDSLDVRFVHKYLLSLQQYINDNLREGAAQPHVYPRDLARLEIPVPPFEEQKRIVAVLDEAFAALDRAHALAEANLDEAEELFLAELRAVFRRKAHTWEKHLLPHLCTHFGRGKSKHRPRNDPVLYGGETPFIQTGDISDADHFLTDYRQTYSAKGLEQSKLWPKGTICIAIVGATIGETAILGFDACFPDSVIGLCPDPSKLDPEFVEFMLQAFKEKLKQAGKGSARDNINLGTFEVQKFPVPDLATQVDAVKRLNETRRAAAQLKVSYAKKVDDLAGLRQSILLKAFSEELMLSDRKPLPV